MQQVRVELWRSRTGKGSSGGRKKGVVCGVGQERLGPSYFFISLVFGPLNNFLWYVPSKFLKVYMELGSYFLFLQEQIKDIIIMRRARETYQPDWRVRGKMRGGETFASTEG